MEVKLVCSLRSVICHFFCELVLNFLVCTELVCDRRQNSFQKVMLKMELQRLHISKKYVMRDYLGQMLY